MRKSFRAEKLDNGVTLLADVFPSSLAALVVGIRMGPLYEARGEKGYSHLLEHMLFNVEGFDVDAAVERLGGESNAYTHRDVVVLTFQALAESFRGLVDAAVRVLANRRYDEGRFEREKQIVLSEMRMNRESPSERIGDLGLRALFGDGDWGIPIDGLPEVISATALRDLLEFKERWIKPDNIIVAVAGGIGEGELEGAGRAFSELEGRGARGDPPPMTRGPGRVEEFDESVDGAYYSYAVKIKAENAYMRLNAAAFHLASGTKSLLFNELRNRGLAYSYYVDFDASGPDGFLQVVVESANDLDAVRRTVKELVQKPREAPEYRLKYFQYEWNKNMEKPLNRAYAYVEAYNKGLDPSRLEEDVRAAVAEGLTALSRAVEYEAEAVIRPRP